MNTGNEDRFHELAHKVLAKEAQPSEQVELRTLVSENPQLKEEFEQMGAETAVAREILQLLEDLQHSHGTIPSPPIERLEKAVCEVFEPRPESQHEVRELLMRLEKWAGRQLGAERERIMELISFLHESLSAQGGAPAAGQMAALRLRQEQYVPVPILQYEAMECAIPPEREETKREEQELENRLRALEVRIGRAEEITHECRDEVRGLLEAFSRNREVKGERRGQKPKSAVPE